MRILMAGGGTAGHINPAISIANTIKKNHPDAEIAFVGTKRGLENKLVVDEGYDLYHIDVKGFERKLSLELIETGFLMVKSSIQTRKIIKEFKPDIVIGTGGYVSWPPLFVASMMKIPTAVHESNAKLGLAIEMVAGRIDRIFLNFKETEKYIKDKSKIMHVGNPIRASFGGLSKKEAREKLGISENQTYVLSFGGSLGAQRINEVAFSFMSAVSKNDKSIVHHHATGGANYPEFSAKYKELGLEEHSNIKLFEYINDMAVRMSAADIVICRAGAMTISELALMKKACIMIPSPNVSDNHQYKNAKVLADAGAVVLLEESELTDEIFKNELCSLIENENKREELSANIAGFANADANKLIYDEIMKLIKNKE